MTSTFPPHCLNFPELSYHKISYKILQVIGWSWRFPYHHCALSLAKPLWVYGRQCRIRVEAEETWMVFRSGGGLILAPPTLNTMNLLQIISFLNWNGRKNGRYHRQLNIIDIQLAFAIIHVYLVLPDIQRDTGIPIQRFPFISLPTRSLALFLPLALIPNEASNCRTHFKLLSCSAGVFSRPQKLVSNHSRFQDILDTCLPQHRTHPSVFSAPMISEASPKLLQTLWQLWQIFSPPKPRLEWCHGSH